ncbi:MAG: response regulator [Rhodanobacteraceae bacterium]
MGGFGFLKRLMGLEKPPPDIKPVERRQAPRVQGSLGARVLVVDDSPTIRAVLGKMLSQDGYNVLKAPDGETAVTLAHSEKPELIFLDIVLPGVSGFSVLRTLRRDPQTKHIPIVMISGNLQATEQFYVQRFGADDFMKKPFGRAEVFERIRALVQSGRLAARSASAPMPALIEPGMSAEEWNAIPDIAMPDSHTRDAAVQSGRVELPAERM